MLFLNNTESIGIILNAGTSNLTGSFVATLFLILIFLLAVALMFGIPLEFLAIIIIPFCLGVASFYQIFWIPLIIIIVYLGTIIAKNWIFR